MQGIQNRISKLVTPNARGTQNDGGSKRLGDPGTHLVITEEERYRFRIAWEEALHQLEEKFNSWVSVTDDVVHKTNSEINQIPKEVRDKIVNATGVDEKFLVMRDEYVALFKASQQEMLKHLELPTNEELKDVYKSLEAANLKIAELRHALNSIEEHW